MSHSIFRYAAALCDTIATIPPTEAAAILSSGHALSRLMEEDRELSRFFASPAFSVEEKDIMAREIARRSEIDPLLQNLFFTLVQQRRTAELGAIIAMAERRYHQRQGIVEIELRTADPLTDEDIAGLRPTLTRLFGERLYIRRAVDPALLGGIVVRTGTLLHDASLAGQIRRLNTYLNKGERHDA
ncbi:MAG TPA: ATP synthase F1 subunit delta [bacterium]|nr:ATP synthase F1 subunit delta [bacterium]